MLQNSLRNFSCKNWIKSWENYVRRVSCFLWNIECSYVRLSLTNLSVTNRIRIYIMHGEVVALVAARSTPPQWHKAIQFCYSQGYLNLCLWTLFNSRNNRYRTREYVCFRLMQKAVLRPHFVLEIYTLLHAFSPLWKTSAEERLLMIPTTSPRILKL